ncbi:hypothetical protein C8Q69DRAFT_478758 [Paecilomyces variotii]|uniref:Flavoprotein oxygenase n=1 Tax=Byssochlamys spectabilis TaxID=264951 RepID=A0A443HKB9_BYSSP|nr:hypothetical protein C8Q69DRAFT_478758 [Paecilomyces variotii]KAJ9260268.1 hypothetical protein DTO195F2_4558 [Paecilomyces variotii]KAJ9286711.1 hypothetical protein DTO021C3_5660 [Paecilomyces variotii]KAJ9359835.1 hypothetical protein DTO280E4_4513 [Paecilomyces variotii]KAJ9367989.1 hypothetical protein DTO282E5_7299 [Paecilomyces variotii]RWQ92312.1 hypothetical protein C8Q69DRAFT_478758 [Paecilomyces variotii]
MEDIFDASKVTKVDDGDTTLQPHAFDGDQLSSTFVTAEIPADVTDSLEHPDDEYPRDGSDVNYGYNSSSSSRLSGRDSLEDDLSDDAPHVQSAASSRSSISSIPESVLIHPTDYAPTPTTSDSKRTGNGHATADRDWSDKRDGSMKFVPKVRDRQPAFRKPSSVRAMQMHTEDEDEDYLSPTRRRATGYSPRHSGMTPVKRSPCHSPYGSAHKPKVKKEYPLVLLHCNLLPPSLSLPAGIGNPTSQILQEVLPLRYWKRWKLLEEKVIGSGVLRERGVLISHPQDAYDVLEERLLESLELVHPRLRNGHFLSGGGDDTEKEDSETDTKIDAESEEGEECPDCGGWVVDHKDSGRKWEIKVYAANGLMRAGAWAAAWKEMEKVDVEVSLWLPSKIRRELEKRFLEERANRSEEEFRNSEEDKRRIDLYAAAPTLIDGFDDTPRFNNEHFHVPQPKDLQQNQQSPIPPGYDPKAAREIDLQTLLINYIRILARDRRNLVIAFLSVLVVFFAFGAHPAGREVARIQTETVPVAAVSAAQYSAVSYTPSSQAQPKIETVVEPAVHVKSEEPVAQATAELSVVSSLSVSEKVASKDDYPDPVPAVLAVDSPVEAGMDQVEVAIEPQLLEPGKELLLLDA